MELSQIMAKLLLNAVEETPIAHALVIPYEGVRPWYCPRCRHILGSSCCGSGLQCSECGFLLSRLMFVQLVELHPHRLEHEGQTQQRGTFMRIGNTFYYRQQEPLEVIMTKRIADATSAEASSALTNEGQVEYHTGGNVGGGTRMVIGGMDEKHRPMVPVVVRGAGGPERKFVCLLWTGFSGELLLPEADVAALGLPCTGTRNVKFADGSQIEATAHPVQVLLAGEARDVEALAWHGEPRLGMGLLQGYQIRMAFVDGGTVSVEKL